MRHFLKSTGLVCLIVLSSGNSIAQTTINGGRVVTGSWDASNATSSKPAKTGSTLPGACGVGEQYFNTSASQGQNLYFCVAPNTWVQMTGGGSGGSSGGSGGGVPSVLLFKGDLIGFASQDVRIPVGPDGSSLTADSTQGGGLGYRYDSGSDIFANRPACTPALTGQTFYPTDGILGYRCNGSAWSGFGPISPITPPRVNGANSYGVVGIGSSLLTAAAARTGNLTVSSCQTFPTTVTMVVVDSEVIAGTCTGTTFTPIAGGRGYNQTTAATHNTGAAATEQLFVWANNLAGTSTQGPATVAASAGYIALTANPGAAVSPILAKPIPNGPGQPYTVTAGFLMNGVASGDQGCGMGFRQSSNNNQVIVIYHSITYTPTGFIVGEYQIADTNFNGTYLNDLAASTITGNGMYFRLQDRAGQRNVYISTDGINFPLIHTVWDGDFLTADQVYIQCGSSGIPQMGSFFSWSESN